MLFVVRGWFPSNAPQDTAILYMQYGQKRKNECSTDESSSSVVCSTITLYTVAILLRINVRRVGTRRPKCRPTDLGRF